jgi:LPXTG-motif cell wall-anchored protein
VTTTTIPTNVLGENFVKSPAAPAASTDAPLARTGSNFRTLLSWAGLALALGGLALMVRERESQS